MPILQDNELKKGSSAKRIYYGIIAILIVLIPSQMILHLYMFFSMFKEPLEAVKIPITLMPEKFLWGNIIDTFNLFKLWKNIINTLLLCGGVILVQVPISALCGFALSKLELKGAKMLLLFFMGTMMISHQATIIPTYLMMFDFPITHWNLIDSNWSVILAFSAWGWTIFLFKNFFDSLPLALIEAARIDGSGNLSTFFRIIIPLSAPVFSIAILNTFTAVYSQFLVPLMLLPSREKWPLMVQIYISTLSGTPWNQIMVLLTAASIPLILIYILAQKYIIEGITMTGLKG